MADSMRGNRLGSTSYEVDPGVLAPRILTTYLCPADHQFTMPFSVEADEIPDIWECECGQKAFRADLTKQGIQDAVGPVKTPKTHYDQLMERRSKGDLQELLKERINELRPKRAS